MRIGIVYIGDNKKLEAYKNTFVNRLSGKGHTIREISNKGPEQRISGMQYLVFFIDSGPLFSKKYLLELQNFFRNCGLVSSHFASVFIPSRPLVNKTFLKYMKEIEHQGMIIHYSDIIENNNHALDILENFEPTMN